MLECRAGVARVVETEDARAGVVARQVTDLGVVAVDDEAGLRQRGDGVAPAGGDGLELAVAVELVAEEIAQEHRARLDAPGDLGERGLVDLEEAELRVACVEQGGGDARDEVGAGGVVGEPHARPQDLREHRRRRRLPVRRRDEHGAARQFPGQPVDRARIELPEQFPGQRRAAAAPGDS